ncbi:MAG TPA: dihydrofolate reductase family protein [Bacteroidales bacterium]|nr:dihydrofolate reductase family protein [Bacteroidales bacterium]
MSKTILYIATSLDGKIARMDGSLDWLYALPNPNHIDYGYEQFLSTIGATIMGKNTYKEILGFGVDWPYAGLKSYVVTTDKAFKSTTPDTFIVSNNLKDLVNDLKKRNKKDIWLIGGGQLIASFLDNDLLDSMILTLIPTTIGEGIRLFQDISKETTWTLKSVERFETGVVNLTYDRK